MTCFKFMAQANNLLFVLLLLLYHTLCPPAPVSSAEENEVLNVDVFTPSKEIKVVQTLTEVSKIDITPQKIKPPVLFAAAKNGVIVVIAETNYKKSGGDDLGVGNGVNVEVVSRNFETNGEGKLDKEVFKEVDKNKWKTQLVTEKSKPANKFSKIITSTINADKDKIYVFLLNITGENNDKKWEFKLVEGKINGVKAGERTIKWEKESFTLTKQDKDIKKKLTGNEPELTLADGSVFVTKEEQFLFVLKGEIKNKGTDDSGTIKCDYFFFFKKQETGKILELLEDNIVEGSYSFFQWQEKIFRTPIDLIAGSNEMTFFDAASQNFNKTDDPVAHLRDFLKNKNNFVTAKIEQRDVLLLTQEKTEQNKNNVYLWMTDGTRVVNTGIIASIESKKKFYGSVLQTDTELFALYQTYDTENCDLTGDNNKIHLTMLKTQHENITKTLEAWKNNSERIKEFYKDIATGTNPRFTDGLVGFLSNTEDNKQWRDEYLNANATIHDTGELKRDGNGFTFSGAGAGAVWRVGKTEEKEQPYNLKEFGFTLVATAKINVTANKKNSILGIGLKESGGTVKRISLWCSNEGKWAVDKKEDSTALVSTSQTCEQDEAYSVVLMLDKKPDKLKVYIDGNELSITQTDITKIEDEETISHFYFGADENQSSVETQVSVKNVLLYNRPLDGNEITNLKVPIKKNVKNRKETGGTTNPLGQQSDNNTKNNEGVNNEESGGSEKKQTSTQPSTTEDSAVRVGVVGVLCFLLFGVFTLLGRYVY